MCQLAVGSSESADASADSVVIDAHTLQLRAARDGDGPGRTYTISINCTDSAGAVSSQSVAVVVPHDQG